MRSYLILGHVTQEGLALNSNLLYGPHEWRILLGDEQCTFEIVTEDYFLTRRLSKTSDGELWQDETRKGQSYGLDGDIPKVVESLHHKLQYKEWEEFVF